MSRKRSLSLYEFLKKAFSRIKDPDNWITGVYARNKDGHAVEGDDKDACCFCSIGALESIEGHCVKFRDAKSFLADFFPNRSIIEQDNMEHKEVVSRWKKAIRKAKGKKWMDT